MAETPNSGSVADNDEEKLCLVCNDVSSGKHYGAVTCEGCKGFFRRIICYNHQNTYQCINPEVQNECPITNDSTRRKCCKSCRFRKCLTIGMRPELCIKIERPDSRSTLSLDINGNDDPLFESEEQIHQLRREISTAYEQNFNPLGESLPNKESISTQYCLIINQLRLQLEAKIRRFVSFVAIFRQLDVNVQSRLISDSMTELLVLMIVFNLERYQTLIRQNNRFFGDQELDTNFRSLIAIMNELTNEILDNKSRISNGGTDPILSLIPALYLLAIVDSHRVESSDETLERLHVQKTKDRIMTAFDLLNESKAGKISQILHFLKVMNSLFEKLRVF